MAKFKCVVVKGVGRAILRTLPSITGPLGGIALEGQEFLIDSATVEGKSDNSLFDTTWYKIDGKNLYINKKDVEIKETIGEDGLIFVKNISPRNEKETLADRNAVVSAVAKVAGGVLEVVRKADEAIDDEGLMAVMETSRQGAKKKKKKKSTKKVNINKNKGESNKKQSISYNEKANAVDSARTESVGEGDENIPDNPNMFRYAAFFLNTSKYTKGIFKNAVLKENPNKKMSPGLKYQTEKVTPKWAMNHKSKDKYKTKINGKSNNTKSMSLINILELIEDNMNITHGYTRNEINQHLHINFNRWRINHPDMFIQNTMGVVIFTRPDLNLFNGKQVNSMISRDPRDNLIINTHPHVAQLLTLKGYNHNTSHKFNPLLSNLAQSLEIMDDNVDTLTTGETYTGYKMQYSKHNIASITSGTFTVKYNETFDRAVTDMHQLWVDYQSNVYRGIYEPKRKYIYRKELDYACDVYYFLLAEDGETILFWSKYYGVFPHNVPKSVYSFDFGSRVSLPELSVTYSYIYKEDLSPVALREFNMNALGDNNPTAKNMHYITNYNKHLLHSNTTWVGVPFVHSYYYDNGLQKNVQGFKLGWAKKKKITEEKK